MFVVQAESRNLGGPGSSGSTETEAANRRRTTDPPNRTGGVEGNVRWIHPAWPLDLIESSDLLFFIFPVFTRLSGSAESGPGMADPPDWTTEDPSFHLQLPEPSGSRFVPQRDQWDPQTDRSVCLSLPLKIKIDNRFSPVDDPVSLLLSWFWSQGSWSGSESCCWATTESRLSLKSWAIVKVWRDWSWQWTGTWTTFQTRYKHTRKPDSKACVNPNFNQFQVWIDKTERL